MDRTFLNSEEAAAAACRFRNFSYEVGDVSKGVRADYACVQSIPSRTLLPDFFFFFNLNEKK